MTNNEMKEDLRVSCSQGKFVFLYTTTLVTVVISYRCVDLQGLSGLTADWFPSITTRY